MDVEAPTMLDLPIQLWVLLRALSRKAAQHAPQEFIDNATGSTSPQSSSPTMVFLVFNPL
jgi:hypothetical protein